MLKPVLGLLATGAVAVLLWKLLVVTLLPLVGIAVGLVFLVVKLAFIACAVVFAIWLVRRLTRNQAGASA